MGPSKDMRFLGPSKDMRFSGPSKDMSAIFHCLTLWKTVLFVSSRAFLLSTPVENSEATWKKATKCNKICISERISVS